MPSTKDGWIKQGACRLTDPDELFVQGAAQNRAKTICRRCPVRTECLADALDNRIPFGVWGGMTERERRALLRRRPNVPSWRELLETARAEHAQVQIIVQVGRRAKRTASDKTGPNNVIQLPAKPVIAADQKVPAPRKPSRRASTNPDHAAVLDAISGIPRQPGRYDPIVLEISRVTNLTPIEVGDVLRELEETGRISVEMADGGVMYVPLESA